MVTPPVPGKKSAEGWNAPLWLSPLLAGIVSYVVAALLLEFRPLDDTSLRVLWLGDIGSAVALLSTLATSVMTVTTLLFSLTIVTLQLASQQFSPRLLRDFAHDPVTKYVLTILTVTFVFCTTALGGLKETDLVPIAAVLGSHFLGLGSLVAILLFVAHMIKAVRVDTMMLTVHKQTHRVIRQFYPPYDDTKSRSPDELSVDPARAHIVMARRSGFVRMIDVAEVVETAVRHDAIVWMQVRAGDHIGKGTPVALVWPSHDLSIDALDDAVLAGLKVGYERTFDQDAAFGFRQLQDIAVRAVSPGINDPVTAATATGHMGDLLIHLTQCRLGPTLHCDSEGRPRAVVPDRDLRFYLDLSCGELRRFGAKEPTVLGALLRMLRDVAASCRDDNQREEVRRAARLVAAEAAEAMRPFDAEGVENLRQRVELALAGKIREAFGDRSGETRSF